MSALSLHPAPTVPLIRLERVSLTFDAGIVVALKDIDLSVYPTERIAALGHSGSGKTSLVNVMGGCDRASSGRVYWKGEELSHWSDWTRLRGIEIGIVFQDFLLLPALTAVENVEMAMVCRGVLQRERARRAAALLDEVGLGDRLSHLPNALSGGERQRVSIARSIANGPALLLADEPTGNLDTANAALVMDLLFRIQRDRGMAMLLVTHDESLAARCDRRIRLRDGRIVEDTSGSLETEGRR
ncbi:MAG: ABC transporter ATP-binding protein [Bauldia sp.]|nr:ABC transporter ATP-binding protein [Bauldia sp.]